MLLSRQLLQRVYGLHQIGEVQDKVDEGPCHCQDAESHLGSAIVAPELKLVGAALPREFVP